jgi:hypothetical protein
MYMAFTHFACMNGQASAAYAAEGPDTHCICHGLNGQEAVAHADKASHGYSSG